MAAVLAGQTLSVLGSHDVGSRFSTAQAIASDGANLYTVTLSGSRFVLRKLDSAGNELWTRQSAEGPWQTAGVVSADGAIYVAGVVQGAAPGETGTGGFDIYVAGYDSAGNPLWLRQFGTPGDDEGAALAADQTGVYVSSAAWVFARQNYNGGVRKYSPEGAVLWTRDLTGLANWWLPLAADGANLYMAAATGANGKPWSNGQPSSTALRRYTSNGSEQWTRYLGDRLAGIGGLAVDTAGVFAVFENASVPGRTFSLRKFDVNANELWATSIAPLTSTDSPFHALAVDATGIYLGGSTRIALRGQCYAGNFDAVVNKFDLTTGKEIWLREFGTAQSDAVGGLTANDSGVFILTGPSLTKLSGAPAAPSGSRIVNECVLNAASNIGGGVVPGEIVDIAVTGPATRVLFNGIAAGILAESQGRITALVPLEIANRNTVDVQVEAQGALSEALTLPVLTTRLGIFSADRSGAGQAAVVNEDGSLNGPGHPAQSGSVISFYATGGTADGVKVALSNEIIAYPEVDGGMEDFRYYAPILYSGTRDGLLQINLRIPAGVPSGSAVPVRVFVAGVPVEQSLTIAVGQ